MNGNSKCIDIKNKDPQTISKVSLFLRNQIGRKVSENIIKDVSDILYYSDIMQVNAYCLRSNFMGLDSQYWLLYVDIQSNSMIDFISSIDSISSQYNFSVLILHHNIGDVFKCTDGIWWIQEACVEC